MDTSTSTRWADQAGIWASFACLIHCALTPTIMVLLPGLFLGGDYVHLILAIVLPLLALIAFLPGFRIHRQWNIPAIGAVGLIFLLAGLLTPASGDKAPNTHVHGLLPTVFTMIGSAVLIFAHWRNRRLICNPGKCQKTPACDPLA